MAVMKNNKEGRKWQLETIMQEPVEPVKTYLHLKADFISDMLEDRLQENATRHADRRQRHVGVKL